MYFLNSSKELASFSLSQQSNQNTIKGILTNPVYTGKQVFHREETTRLLSASETYKVRRKVDEEEQVVIENAHPALITDDDYKSVQELMSIFK